jgi:hypothetical protein
MPASRLGVFVEALRARPFARRLRWVLSNCGGTNDESRFAGNLLRGNLSERERLRIYHALIFPNGVRKTSAPARNTRDLRALVDSGHLRLSPALRVLDVGSSLGLDALSTAELLRTRGHEVREFVLGDLYPRVLYDVDRELVFDEDGHLLQVRRKGSFVAVNFAYNHATQRFTHAPKRLYPWLLKRRYSFDRSARMVPIPLVHPLVPLDTPSSPFRLRRMNVFEPLGDRFDLIICMNLLLRRYFGPYAIQRAVENLVAHLEPHGTAVLGGADGLRVLRVEETSGAVRSCCTSWRFCDGCARSDAQATLDTPRSCEWSAHADAPGRAGAPRPSMPRGPPSLHTAAP